MKTCVQLFAAALVLMTVSSAKAVPVYGTITGTVVGVTSGDGWPPFGVGTPVTGFYQYTPANLVGGSTISDPTEEYYLNIAGIGFGYGSGNLNMTIGANGEPVSGLGSAGIDLIIESPSGVALNLASLDIIDVGVTYLTPSTTVPDTASTSCLAGIAMLSLAVFGRLTSQSRKDQPSA